MEAALLLTLYVGKLIWGADYQIEPHDALESITQYSQLSVRILIVVVAVAAAPVVEELVFRGMLQTMIRSYLAARRSPLAAQGTGYEEGAAERSGAWPAIIISSALFASIHAIPAHWPALFVLGVCLGYSYEKSGSLLRPFFIHSFFNAITVTVALSQ
jgi:membrane protease YdiL (CAAX protease family)